MGRVEGGKTHPLFDFSRVLRLIADHTYLVTGGRVFTYTLSVELVVT